jgi:hypothetical protein
VKNFYKFIVPALIAVLVTQVSRADERLVEGTEKAVINLKTSAATNNAEKKIICKKIKVTGSHLKRRVCLSAERWEILREKTQQQLDDIMSSSASAGGGIRN